MTSSWGERVEQALVEILELPTSERPAYLAKLASQDSRLRDELASLLSAHAANSSSFADPPNDRTGTVVDGYVILGKLGNGGGGTVYKARRPASEDHAALKFLHPSLPLAQVWHEQRMLGHLTHAGVVRFYGSGVAPDGQPYLAVEYVAGTTLVEHCRRSKAPLSVCLGLFSQLCEAVQLAHERNLVHGDLKPGNVLVDDRGTVRLVDFGIARRLDSVSTRRTGLRGTPEYAAPEQHRGEPPTPASDVYALGVVLYQLLSAAIPFARNRQLDADAQILELGKRVNSQDPRPPSRAARQAPAHLRPALSRSEFRELDRIVLKAMARDPVQRFPSVLALGEELLRFQRAESLRHISENVIQRARKLARRRRVPLLVVLAVTSFALFMLAGRAQQSKRADSAERILDGVLTGHDVAAGPRQLADVEEVLARAVTVASDPGQDANLRGRVLTRVGSSYVRLAVFGRAEPVLRDALALHTRAGPDDDPALARDHLALGELYYERAAYAQAGKHGQEALRRARRDAPHDHALNAAAVTLVAAILRAGGEVAVSEKLLATEQTRLSAAHAPADVNAEVMGELANAAFQLGQFARAEQLNAAVLEHERTTLGESHPFVADSLINQALIRARQDRMHDAVRDAQEAFSILEDYRGAHPDTAAALVELAGLLMMNLRLDEAAVALGQARVVYEQTGEVTRPRRIALLGKSSSLSMLRGDYAAAERDAEALLALVERQTPPATRASILDTVGSVYIEAKENLSQAERAFMQALDTGRGSQTISPEQRAITRLKVARVHLLQGRNFQALAELCAVITALARLGASQVWLAPALFDLVRAYRALGMERGALATECVLAGAPLRMLGNAGSPLCSQFQ